MFLIPAQNTILEFLGLGPNKLVFNEESGLGDDICYSLRLAALRKIDSIQMFSFAFESQVDYAATAAKTI